MKLQELQDLYEMSNLVPADTGLTMTVYVSVKNSSHGPRIKVMNTNGIGYTDDNFSVSISDDPKVEAGDVKISADKLKQVFEFVKKNKEVLLKYWEFEIGTKEMVNSIQSI